MGLLGGESKAWSRLSSSVEIDLLREQADWSVSLYLITVPCRASGLNKGINRWL